jgi:hypothetical protein
LKRQFPSTVQREFESTLPRQFPSTVQHKFEKHPAASIPVKVAVNGAKAPFRRS